MNAVGLRKVIVGVTLLWVLLGLALAAATLTEALSLNSFAKLFAAGFVIYAVAVTIMFKMLSDRSGSE